MRVFTFVACALVACSSDPPPLLGDYEGGAEFSADAFRPPQVIEAGADSGAVEELDFEGVCTAGEAPVWHFFDFQTQTPGDSSLVMTAYTGDTEAALDSAKPAPLATVSGPDITSWTGVDVDPVLVQIGEHSRLFLRVTVEAKPASDGGGVPVLVHYRQQFDCVVGQ